MSAGIPTSFEESSLPVKRALTDIPKYSEIGIIYFASITDPSFIHLLIADVEAPVALCRPTCENLFLSLFSS